MLLEKFGAKQVPEPRRHDGVQPIADHQGSRDGRIADCRDWVQDDLPSPGAQRQIDCIDGHRCRDANRIGARDRRPDGFQRDAIEGKRQEEKRASKADDDLDDAYLHVDAPWNGSTGVDPSNGPFLNPCFAPDGLIQRQPVCRAPRKITPRSIIITNGPIGVLPKVIPPGRSPKATRSARAKPNTPIRIACSPRRTPWRIWSRARKAAGTAIAAMS